jgi:hypothetical protein
MDDYTWHKKIYERQHQQKRDFLTFGLLIAAILCVSTAAWYFLFHIRTPEYALGAIQDAIEKKDAAKLDKYINLPLLTSKAYDDLTRDLFAYDPSLTPQTKIMFEKFYIVIKPQITEGTADTIKERVTAGSWPSPSGSNILKGRQLGIDYERFLENTQLRNTELVSIGNVKRDGRSADASITVRDTYTQTEFKLSLDMEQADDGHWQVAYIRNYREYLDAIVPLQNQGIADYIQATKAIVSAYNVQSNAIHTRFTALTKTTDGHLSRARIADIDKLISKAAVPALQDYQAKLDAIEIPAGASYLAGLRSSSTKTTIAAWQHFAAGLKDGRQSELDTAETLHKREIELDLRIAEIIRHAAVSQSLPNIQ